MLNIQSDAKYSIKCAIQSFIATYISGILHPLDLIKTRFQSHDGKSQVQNLVPRYTGIFNGLKSIYHTQGFKGIYKGFHVSVLSQATAMALFFWVYEWGKVFYEKKGFNMMNAVLISSFAASIFGTVVTQPLWVIKTRMLLNTKSGITQMQNFIFSCRQIYRQEGLKGYSRGLGLSFVLSANGVVQMYSYEGLKLLYDYLNIQQAQLFEKSFVCGSASKIFVVLVSYPITTIRTRIQQNQFIRNDQTKKYSGIGQIIRKIFNEEGIFGFFKGLKANLIKGVLQKGIYFYAYELLKLRFVKKIEIN